MARISLIGRTEIASFLIVRSKLRNSSPAIFLVAQLVLFWACSSGVAAAAPTAKLEEVTLEWHGQILKPSRVATPWLPEYHAGRQLIVLSNTTVFGFDSTNRALLWHTTFSGSGWLRLWDATEDIGYLQLYPTNYPPVKPALIPKIKRLDLHSGKWLSDLEIPSEEKETIVLEARAWTNGVIVLSGGIDRDDRSRGPLRTYRLSCFSEPSGATNWSKSFQADPEAGPPSAFLLSGPLASESVPDIRYLSLLDDGEVLVCAGPRQAIMHIDRRTGALQWSIERIWELERGFTGPSNWQHFISRFGDVEQVWKDHQDSAASTAFEKQWSCEIVGGPIVVKAKRVKEWSRAADTSIFVAVSKAQSDGARGQWDRYLSDCVVYEFDSQGKPVSMVNLPRMVIGSQTVTQSNAVIWGLQNNAVARLEVSDNYNSGFFGTDLLTRVSWYKEFPTPESEAWLVTGKMGEPTAFGSSQLYRVPSGGYVNKSNDMMFYLPLTGIDYADGKSESFLLNVPLTHTVPVPETNFSGGGNSIHTLGSYFLGITWLAIDGDDLSITLGMEDWSGTVTFRLNNKTGK